MRICLSLALVLGLLCACQGPNVGAEAQRLSTPATAPGTPRTYGGEPIQEAPAAALPTAVDAPEPTPPAAPNAPAPTAFSPCAPTCAPAPVCCDPCDIGEWPTTPCRSTYLDASLSLLPNIGVGVGGGKVFWRRPNDIWAFEVLGTYQFLDDEDFSSDGNPGAGDWYQIRAGIKNTFAPKSRRHLTTRWGAVWFKAKGAPNIIGQPGDYYGIYGGVGFETDLTSSLTVGPELSVMVVTEVDEFHVVRPVPQLNWHVTWWLGKGGNGCTTKAPLGELYVGAFGMLSPGLGGGIEGGQVFARSSLATWSFELLAGAQSPSDALAFEEDGKWSQIRGGVKASFQPCGCGHWTARGGVAWLRSTAANEFLDETGDYIGVYLGGGYEWDIGRRFATGPELSVMLMSQEQEFDVQVVPQLSWHFIVKL